MSLARPGPAYLGLAWPGSRPQAGPCTPLPSIVNSRPKSHRISQQSLEDGASAQQETYVDCSLPLASLRDPGLLYWDQQAREVRKRGEAVVVDDGETVERGWRDCQ